jgi:hypothetical protein
MESENKSVVPGIIIIILLIPGAFWRGYYISVLYMWFMPPTWPVLTVKIAIGLSILLSIFRNETFKPVTDDDGDPWKSLIKFLGIVFLTPLLMLGSARVILWFL